MEGAQPKTNMELYLTPGSLGVFGAGCLILLYVVHKSRRGEKRVRKENPRYQNAALKRPKK